ncbi:phage tail protein [Pseudomonas sp. NBRC 111142]|uniref:phage tail protein n=1 Tax=Pseudomonas sp. NBRC 111142 TaxID=1661057 RepID=UPI002109F38C|nr:phage tail protein [Pseudomonas sp. NBRC 111142]
MVGNGTNFTLNARVGDAFQGPDGRWYEVANVASANVLGILPAYQGATVAAGAYGLAPMQGYVKEAADRLRQVVDQWGSTLALFGGATDVATLRTNIGAAKSGANNDITSLTGMTTALSIAQGGTGGATAPAARSGLGLKSAAIADIVGPVSQSGGTPTGAIIERGANASGNYTKFADGTLICWGYVSAVNTNLGVSNFLGTTSGGTYYQNINITFPAVFAGSISLIPTLASGGGFGARPTTITTNGAIVQVYSGTAGNNDMCWIATGRWY